MGEQGEPQLGEDSILGVGAKGLSGVDLEVDPALADLESVVLEVPKAGVVGLGDFLREGRHELRLQDVEKGGEVRVGLGHIDRLGAGGYLDLGQRVSLVPGAVEVFYLPLLVFEVLAP